MKNPTLTPAVREMVTKELRRPGAIPTSIARRYNVPLRTLRSIQEEEGLVVSRTRSLQGDCQGEIPDRLKPFVLHVKALQDPWPDTPEIAQAKNDYDEGLVELCTGRLRREGARDALVLYRIPRRTRDEKRSPYFSHVYEG